MKVSAIVITKNEERVIDRCLSSLTWCNEIIVVDSGSTDRTTSIAELRGARVLIETDWQGPATQRNRGMKAATGEWLLFLDADEWITEALRDEISSILASPHTKSAFRMPRASSYCGQIMRHSGWWPDYITRLLRKGAGYFEGFLHERAIVDGEIGTLSQPLHHEPFRDLEQVLCKLNTYSSLGAQELVRKGSCPSLTKAVLHGLWTFARTYVLRAGFLDGKRGFMLAVSNAEGTYYKYVKAMLLAETEQKVAK